MRTREDIESEGNTYNRFDSTPGLVNVVLEVLLDIRDLLAKQY